MSNFADVIAKDRGQPANARVGVVTSTSPLLINVQGTNFRDVGVLGGYTPVVGDVVALLGQSAVSADAATWLVLGRIGTDPAISVTNVENGAGVVTAGLAFVASGGGGAACGVAFTAPASGRCLILWNVEITLAANGFALCSPQVATGSAIGSGTVHTGWAASFDRTRRNDVAANVIRAGSSDLCTGLTPGNPYNVLLMYATNGVNATFGRRSVVVVPVP